MKKLEKSLSVIVGEPYQEKPMDYGQMMKVINDIAERYSFCSISYLGESIMGRGIPVISLGEGKKASLYVGAHHGMEWITTLVLLRFIREYCALYQSKSSLFGLSLPYFFSSRTIHIVPMLNPDGVEYQLHGIAPDNPLYDRLLAMNHGSNDFSHWQANARGVDLNHNYNSGFAEYKKLESEHGILGGASTRYSGEAPESEPEVGHLCNFIRYNSSIKQVLSFHTQGEEIYDGAAKFSCLRTKEIAKKLSVLSGYTLASAEGMAAYGGLSDWCAEELELPAFTVECGKGKNPLPVKDGFPIYLRIRKLLFLAPTLI
ncbi:MAG: peptidase M14 [Ruminococcaceae bacterium]|nr:peptidase M14 [Oscillospiraceae bacterium]